MKSICFYAPEPYVSAAIKEMLRERLTSLLETEDKLEIIIFEQATPVVLMALDLINDLRNDFPEKKVYTIALIDPVRFDGEYQIHTGRYEDITVSHDFNVGLHNCDEIYGIPAEKYNWLRYGYRYNGAEEREGKIKAHKDKFRCAALLSADVVFIYYYNELLDIGVQADKFMKKFWRELKSRQNKNETIWLKDPLVEKQLKYEIDNFSEPARTIFIDASQGILFPAIADKCAVSYYYTKSLATTISGRLRKCIQYKLNPLTVFPRQI